MLSPSQVKPCMLATTCTRSWLRCSLMAQHVCPAISSEFHLGLTTLPDLFPTPAVVPSSPGRVLASRNTKTSVVVQWDRPKHEEDLLGYYVDCCVAGTNQWEPCNHKPIGYNRCPPLLPGVCGLGGAEAEHRAPWGS